jgi:hypothetical protein
MPLYLDLATRLLRLYQEGRTITEMAVLLSRPENEVREALTMLGVAKAPGPFGSPGKGIDEHIEEMQGATADRAPPVRI